MNQPGPKPLPPRFELTDDSATTWAKARRDPPEHGSSPYLFRFFGARRLLANETCAAIIDLMTPHQLLIVQARLEGLPDPAIADVMQISTAAVRQHISRLRKRIYRELPHLRPLITGRRFRSPP
jgi:DNA-directed RNA polymerase specialized sigma24 family protein